MHREYLLEQKRKCELAIMLAVSPRMAAWPKAQLAAIEYKLQHSPANQGQAPQFETVDQMTRREK